MTIATRVAWDGGLGVDTDSDGGDFLPEVTAPVSPVPSDWRIVAESIESVVIDGTDYKPLGPSAELPYTRHRIIVGGKDVTYFRGSQTPMPTYSLVSPLRYGAGSLTFPQIHAAFEVPGEGDLSWLKPLAKVKVQRVDAAGDVVDGGDRDFIAYIADFQHQGRKFTVTLGGQGTADATWMYRPPPVFPRVRDVGAQVMRTIQHQLRLPTANRPTTGIDLLESGGGSQFDFLTDILAKSTEKDGDQWTVMPNAAGKYRMFQKDTSTIDATLYIDGAHNAQDLRRDFSEEANRVWVQGVDQDGKRIRFAIWPGLLSTKRAYPGSTLHPGDSGDDVTAMIWRLASTGWLNHVLGVEWTVDLHDQVTEAIKDVQDNAGLNIDGNVNEATWRAIFRGDNKSLNRAQIRPAAARAYTKAHLEDATGNWLGPNPKYDRSRKFIDRILTNMVGFDRGQMERWAKNELADESSPNWVGTITVNAGAVIDGEHNPGDPLTSDLVRDARSIIPGMNLWLANWYGGTLVHVAGVTVRQGAQGTIQVELAVDTRARDTMPVWQVIRRNRETRRLANRNPLELHRRSSLLDDQGSYDGQMFGKIERTFCPAGTWTVIPSPAGRSGTLQGIHLKFSDPVEFAVELWDRERDSDWCNRHVGDWNTEDFWDHFNTHINDWKKNRGLIDHWGDVNQPAGYGYAMKKNQDLEVTAAVLVGEFDFEAGALYVCHGQPVLWIAVRPLEDVWVTGNGADNRALELLLDDAAG